MARIEVKEASATMTLDDREPQWKVVVDYGAFSERHVRELEARFPGALTNADKRELQRLNELLQTGFELTPERAQNVSDALTPKQMARAIGRFDKLMRSGVGREEALVGAIAEEIAAIASDIERARNGRRP